MLERTYTSGDTRRLIRHAEALRGRLLRRWLGRWLRRGLRRLLAAFAAMRGEAELGAMDTHELHDLGLGRGEIAYAARHGREER
jgi:uncharacterized protein YjiS (DUF1127 family)